MNDSRRQRFVAFFFILLGWWHFAGPLLRPESAVYLSDAWCMDVPLRTYAARQIRQGHLPLWTSRVQCGFPLHADGQTGIMYPLNLLYILSPTPEANDWFLAVHYLAIVFATYFVFERVMAPLAASVGANTFLFSAYVQSSHPVPANSSTILWLPVGLYLIDSWRRGSKRALWLCALANGLGILAWEPCTLKNVFLFQALYLAYRIWLGPPRFLTRDDASPDRNDSLADQPWKILVYGKALFIIFGGAVLIAGIQVLPALGFVSQSSRTDGFESALDFEEFRSSRLPSHMLWTILHPDLFGTAWRPRVWMMWEEHLSVFAGFGAIFLIPSAWIFGRNKKEVVFWTIALILGVLLMTGSPVYGLTYYMPVFNWFRWPSRYGIYTAFSLAALAGLGTDGLVAFLRKEVLARHEKGAAIVAWGLGFLAIFGHTRTMEDYLADKNFYAERSEEIIRLAQTEKNFRLMPLASAIYGYSYASESLLRRNAGFLPADYNLYHNVPCATKCGQEHTVTQRAMRDVLRLRHRNGLRAAAISHVSAPESLAALNRPEIDLVSPVYLPPESELEPIADEKCVLYRFRDSLPRVRMVYQTRTISDPMERLNLIGSDAFDPAVEAIVEEEVPLGSPPDVEPKIEWQEEGDSRLTIEVETDAPGLLVVSDTHAPEIFATVDGKPTELLRVNHAFRGIALPAGRHVVIMDCSRKSLIAGAVTSLLGLLLFAAGMLRSGVPKPSNPNSWDDT